MIDSNIKESDVAIIGMGIRFPSAGVLSEFYQNLLTKKDCIIECPDERMSEKFFKFHDIDNHGGYLDYEEWKCHDPLFFGSSIPDSVNQEPQIRLLNRVAYETFENACVLKKIKGSNTSVFIGFHVVEYDDITDKKTIGSYNTSFSTSISYAFDLRGESTVCATACSSSFTAIQRGYESVINGSSDMSLCGGVSSMITTDFREKSIGSFAITQSGRSHTFEAEADGFCRGEGAGLVLLKKYSNAIKDGDKIYGVIKTITSNNDGSNEKMNQAQPSSNAQAENMKNALSKISMNPSEIYYIEPHGTGTPVGDPIEAKAISMVFKDSHNETPLYLGSLKPNIGHLEAASGVSSLIKSCLMMKYRKLIPMFKFNNPNPDIKFNEWNLKMVTSEHDFPSNKLVNIGINNFGIGGTNVFLVLSEHIRIGKIISEESNNIDENYLIPFSANSAKSLQSFQRKLISNIDNIKNNIKFVDFVKNQINKYHFVNRNVVMAKDWDDFKSLNIKSFYGSKSVSTFHYNANSPIVFVFSGQGAQYISMAKDLLNNNKIFRDSFEYCDSILEKYFGYSIYEKLKSLEQSNDKDKNNYLINEPILAQPAMFLIQYSLIELYKHWGIIPSVVLGHSFGEISAAYCSGIISLESTCKLIYNRAIPQNKTAGLGKMLSISIGQDEFENKFSDKPFFKEIEIGCHNSKSSIVIVSEKQYLDLVKHQLDEEGVFNVYLGTDCPFHSSKQSIIEQEIHSLLKFLDNETSNPTIPFYSTVTTNQWTSNDKFNSQYIYDNIAKPVHFDKTLNNIINNEQLLPNKNAMFVELSPHPTLSFYVKSLFDEAITCPLNKKKNDIEQFNESISTIFCNGGKVNFSVQSKHFENQLDSEYKFVNDFMPHYQWDDKECWSESNEFYTKRVEGPPTLSCLKTNGGNKTYETIIDINKPAFSFLKDHEIDGQVVFPGCAYLSTILNLYTKSDITIPYFNCLLPFFIDSNTTYTLQLVISTLSKTDDKFQFFKKENKNGSIWTEVSNGKISTIPFDKTDDNKKQIKQIIEECNLSVLSNDELYSFIKEKYKIVFGQSFRKINQVYLGDKITLSVSETFKEKESFFDDNNFLNTTIIDSCFHGGFVIDQDNNIGKVYMDEIINFRLFSNNIPKSRDQVNKLFYVCEIICRKENSLLLKVEALLEDGTTIFEVCSGFNTNKKINDKIRIQDHRFKYSSEWQLKNSMFDELSKYSLQCDETFKGYSNSIPASNIAACFYFKFIKIYEPSLTLKVIEECSNTEIIGKYLIYKTDIVKKRIFTRVLNIIRNYKELIVSNYSEIEYHNYLKQFYGNPSFILSFGSMGPLFVISQLFNKDASQISNQIIFPEFGEGEEANFFKSFSEIKSQFEFLDNEFLRNYIYKTYPKNLNTILCETVKKMIHPLINEK
ncbi:hypothetical protein ACTFIW_012943 [Dictyostelium discoideum]